MAGEEAIFIKGYGAPGTRIAHDYDAWNNPNQNAEGFPHRGRTNPILELIDLYEDYTNPGHAAPIITTEDGKVSVRSFEPLARHGSYYVTQDLPDQTVIVYEGVQMITDGMTINPDMVDGATIRRQLESSNEIENNK